MTTSYPDPREDPALRRDVGDITAPDPDTVELHPEDDPDAIRAEIDSTRAELSANVDALEERLNPRKMAERQTDKVKSAVTSVKDRVFGMADDAGSSMSSLKESAGQTAGDLADTVREAPDRLKSSAQGNPLAAGLVAAGVGFLLGSLIPSSQKERETVRHLKESEAVSSATEEVKSIAQDLGQQLKEPAKEAAEHVKESAQVGMDNVKATAAEAGTAVKDQASSAASAVKEQTSSSASAVKEGTSSSTTPPATPPVI